MPKKKTRQSATTYQDSSGLKKKELKCEIIHLSDAFDRRHLSLSMALRTTGKSPLSTLTVLPSCRLLVLQHSATRRKCRGTRLCRHNVGLRPPPPPLKSKARFFSRHILGTHCNNPPTTASVLRPTASKVCTRHPRRRRSTRVLAAHTFFGALATNQVSGPPCRLWHKYSISQSART